MKYLAPLLLGLLVGCGPTPPIVPTPRVEVPKLQEVVSTGPDGCNIETSSNLVAQRKVSKILNLVQDIDPNGRCTVNFDLIVDGETHHLEETEIGWQQIPVLCHYAKERARKNLLLELGGDFQSEATITCRHTDNENG